MDHRWDMIAGVGSWVTAWMEAGASVRWVRLDEIEDGTVRWAHLDENEDGEDGRPVEPADPFEDSEPADPFEDSDDGLPVDLAEARTDDWPIFKFHHELKPGVLCGLAVPNKGFGLDLHGARVTGAVMKKLAGFHELRMLDLRSARLTRAGLKELSGLHELRTLDLRGTAVTGRGLQELGGLKNLRTLKVDLTDSILIALREMDRLHALSNAMTANDRRPANADEVAAMDLRGTAVTGRGLQELHRLKNLRTLSVDVTDGILIALGTMSRLHLLPNAQSDHTGPANRPVNSAQVATLDLADTRVTDEGLIALAGLEELRTVDISHTHVFGAGLRYLKNLIKLRTLRIDVTDEVLKALREMDRVHVLSNASTFDNKRPACAAEVVTLNLAGARVTDAGMKELAGFDELRTLDLRSTGVTGAGLKKLPGLWELQTLFVSYVTDGVLKALREMGRLHLLSNATTSDDRRPASDAEVEVMTLGMGELTDACLKELTCLSNLKELNLFLTWVKGDGLKEMAGLSELRTLRLCRSITTDAGMKGLCGLKALQTLSLFGTKVTDAGLKELAELKKLRVLNLGDTLVTDAGMKELACLKELEELTLSDTSVADAGLKELEGLEGLRFLDISNTKVTDAGLKALAGLTALQIRNCSNRMSLDFMLAALTSICPRA